MHVALLLIGCPFTVGEAESLPKMAASSVTVHKMATSSETFHKMAASSESFHKMAAIPEPRPVMSTTTRTTKSVPRLLILISSVEDLPVVSVRVVSYPVTSALLSTTVSMLSNDEFQRTLARPPLCTLVQRLQCYLLWK